MGQTHRSSQLQALVGFTHPPKTGPRRMENLVKPPAAYQFVYLIPEILLTAWGLLVLVVDFSLLRHRPGAQRRRTLGWLALVGCLAVLVYLLWPGLQEGLVGALGADLD